MSITSHPDTDLLKRLYDENDYVLVPWAEVAVGDVIMFECDDEKNYFCIVKRKYLMMHRHRHRLFCFAAIASHKGKFPKAMVQEVHGFVLQGLPDVPVAKYGTWDNGTLVR